MCKPCGGVAAQAEDVETDAIALGFFDGDCGRKLRGELFSIGEDVVAEFSGRIVQAASDFARCSIGLPTQSQASQAAIADLQSTYGLVLTVEQRALYVAYAAWTPPRKCLALAASCLLAGEGFQACALKVVSCVTSDLLGRFGGLIGGAIGGAINGETPTPRPSIGGGPGVVSGGRPAF